VRILEQDAVGAFRSWRPDFDACFIDLLNSFPSEDVTHRVAELCSSAWNPERC